MAFFSRLEERKGIKVFVDALHKLNFPSLSQSQVQLPDQKLLHLIVHSALGLHNVTVARARLAASTHGDSDSDDLFGHFSWMLMFGCWIQECVCLEILENRLSQCRAAGCE